MPFTGLRNGTTLKSKLALWPSIIIKSCFYKDLWIIQCIKIIVISNENFWSEENNQDSTVHRLRWTFLIKICLLSGLSVVVFVIFSHFHLLFRKHWADFNITWHKASRGEKNSSLFKWKVVFVVKGRFKIRKTFLLFFTNLLFESNLAREAQIYVEIYSDNVILSLFKLCSLGVESGNNEGSGFT